MRGFIPNCAHLFQCSLFVLFIVFQSPYDTSLILWGTNIFCSWRVYFCGDVRIPSSATFSFVRKKKYRQTEKQTQIWESIVYTVFRVKWCTYLPGSPKLNKQANPKDAVFRITGGKNLAGSQACQMENLFWMAKCYEIVKFLGLTQRPTQCYNFQFILRKLNRDQKHRNHNWIACSWIWIGGITLSINVLFKIVGYFMPQTEARQHN